MADVITLYDTPIKSTTPNPNYSMDIIVINQSAETTACNEYLHSRPKQKTINDDVLILSCSVATQSRTKNAETTHELSTKDSVGDVNKKGEDIIYLETVTNSSNGNENSQCSSCSSKLSTTSTKNGRDICCMLSKQNFNLAKSNVMKKNRCRQMNRALMRQIIKPSTSESDRYALFLLSMKNYKDERRQLRAKSSTTSSNHTTAPQVSVRPVPLLSGIPLNLVQPVNVARNTGNVARNTSFSGSSIPLQLCAPINPLMGLPIVPPLRPIAIDGSNVAFCHGVKKFSCMGIKIAVDYFLKRGHTSVKAFVPQFRRKSCALVKDSNILESLALSQNVVFTPSRTVNGAQIVCYDDRFVLEYAENVGAVVLSNDNFRDLIKEKPSWKHIITNRLLMYTFADDVFMVPADPMGKSGPSLERFLSF